MDNEKIYNLLEKMYTEFSGRFEKIENELTKTNQHLARIEQDHGEKITALFDGYSMRGDQIERLREHLDERLDVIQTDLSYVVGKVAQHERNFLRLKKPQKKPSKG